MSFRGTTILAVRKGESVAMAGDGQVTLGNTIMKGSARKVRRMYNDEVVTGFAGATADAFTLLSGLKGRLKSTTVILPGRQLNLPRNGVQTGCSENSRRCFWWRIERRLS